MSEKEIKIELKTNLPYAYKGEKLEGTFITLIAPAYKQFEYCVPLKQMVFRVMAKMADSSDGDTNDETDSESALKGRDLISMMYQSDEDMIKFLLYGERLLLSGIAQVEGCEKLTTPLRKSMDSEDFENVLGEYIVNFILASVLSRR